MGRFNFSAVGRCGSLVTCLIWKIGVLSRISLHTCNVPVSGLNNIAKKKLSGSICAVKKRKKIYELRFRKSFMRKTNRKPTLVFIVLSRIS